MWSTLPAVLRKSGGWIMIQWCRRPPKMREIFLTSRHLERSVLAESKDLVNQHRGWSQLDPSASFARRVRRPHFAQDDDMTYGNCTHYYCRFFGAWFSCRGFYFTQ